MHQNILEELNKEVLINLASNEYSKVLNLNKIKSEVITPVFKDYKNGKLRSIKNNTTPYLDTSLNNSALIFKLKNKK